MKKVLTIGGATHDIFIEYEAPQTMHIAGFEDQTFILLEEGKKIEVNTIHDFVGGGATNTAVSFKNLDFDVTTIFKIGDDIAGHTIVESLRNKDIDVSNIITTSDEKTGTSFIIPSKSGDKSALVYRGANLTLEATDIPARTIDQADLVYITSLSKNASHALRPIVMQAHTKQKMVVVNPGGSQISAGAKILCQSLAYINIFILNAQEAKELMHHLTLPNQTFNGAQLFNSNRSLPNLLKDDHFSYLDYFQAILSQGPQIAVVTNGEEGVYIATKNMIYFYPSPHIKVISTLGAGDAFGSCFAGMTLHNKPIEQALIAGILNSCSVISHLGTHTGLLSMVELENQLKEADKALLQKFSVSFE